MRAISRSRSTTAASGCILRLVGVIFLLVGSGVFVGLSALPLRGWFVAQDWPAVPCTILSSEVLTHSSSDGTTYSIHIRYAYEWEGTHYEGDTYNFFSGSSSGYERKQAVVDQYPAGETRECYLNPADPAEAVLNRAFSFVYLVGCFGLIFVFIALFLIFHRPKKGGAITETTIGDLESMMRTRAGGNFTIAGASGALPDAPPDYGTITLKGGNNSIFGFAFMLVFGLIWNGIVCVAVWNTVFSGSSGAFDIVGALFLIPFVLVGLAVIGGTGYFFLTLFNPRPDLTLSPGYLPLGGTATLGWSFRGNPSRIQKLTITVQGQEAATYRRGTSTTTDKNIFEKVIVVETEDIPAIRSGEAPFTMPEFTAPSFTAPNNKIQWHVKVHGEIHRWPDVNEEFELVVSPLPLPAGAAPPQPGEFHISGSGGSA